jgi:hypothetical protein
VRVGHHFVLVARVETFHGVAHKHKLEVVEGGKIEVFGTLKEK